MLLPGVCKCSGWMGKVGVRSSATPPGIAGYPLTGKGSPKVTFLGRSFGKPTIALGTVRPAGVGMKDSPSVQSPANKEPWTLAGPSQNRPGSCLTMSTDHIKPSFKVTTVSCLFFPS